MEIRVLLSVFILLSSAAAEVDIIAEPRPGHEYVFLQASNAGARPISRKDKAAGEYHNFETAHKIPSKLTFTVQDPADLKEVKIKEKREATKAPSAAPPGSIKIDPKKLIEKYRSLIETSTSSPTTSTTKKTRTKKEASSVTTPNSVLTTGAPVTPRVLSINKENSRGGDKLTASSSENKRSRIQIKKGPNGQEYEYEYVYYYYDDDDEDPSVAKDKVTNSHDGPPRSAVSNRGRQSTTRQPEVSSNEVVPSTRGGRARNRELSQELAVEEKVSEERLPQNTRFPPRSRNINTTPVSSEEETTTRTRTRQRGKPAADNTADESQVNNGRSRNRANVRRPSLELVDSESFNTHSSSDPNSQSYKQSKSRGEQTKEPVGGPSFPSELPPGPVRFLGATPNEKTEFQDAKPVAAEESETNTELISDNNNAEIFDDSVTTTEMSAMDKVALDLYAILQGTQKLSGEEKESSTDINDATTTENIEEADSTTTEEITTEEITTPTTTTTTTTTTTPAPTTRTTTTTTEAPTTRGRFRGRPGANGSRFKSQSSTTAAPETSTEKQKGRFSRPGFGSRGRNNGRVTTEASVEPEATKEENKPVSRTSTNSRTRFGGRTRPTTTTSTAATSSESTTASSRPGLTRPRPNSFNLRRRPGVSANKEPTEATENTASEATNAEDTTASTSKPIRGRINANAARPLRPGPRINLATRGRLGAASTTTTTTSPDAAGEVSVQAEDAPQDEDKVAETTPQPDKNPLNKLRNRPKINVSPASRPKPAASASVQVRRTNPLLARRKPVATPEAVEASTEPPQEPGATETDAEEELSSEAPSSTTEEPRGLNKLLAGRRRLIGRHPAH